MSGGGRAGGGSGASEAGGRVPAERGREKLRISGSSHGSSSDTVRLRVYDSYAERWWEDAVGEVPAPGAGAEEARGAVRRQVIFAVCALESWFFEWVRDEVLGDADVAVTLFTEGEREGISDRIKTVTKKLHAEGTLPREPDFDYPKVWQPLCELIEDRNGLVHAVASLPRGDVPPDAKKGRPTPEGLTALAPARPLEIVRGVAVLLTGFTDAEPPDWMKTCPARRRMSDSAPAAVLGRPALPHLASGHRLHLTLGGRP